MLLETSLQNDTILAQNTEPAGVGAQSDIIVNPSPLSGGLDFSCATRTTNVTGAPLIGANNLRVGLRARSITAAFSWLMLVDSPQ